MTDTQKYPYLLDGQLYMTATGPKWFLTSSDESAPRWIRTLERKLQELQILWQLRREAVYMSEEYHRAGQQASLIETRMIRALRENLPYLQLSDDGWQEAAELTSMILMDGDGSLQVVV